MSKADKRSYVRCPWCQRQPVQVKRERIVSHLTPGGVKCIGIGQPMPKQQPTAADLIGHAYYVPSNMADDDMLDDEDRPY